MYKIREALKSDYQVIKQLDGSEKNMHLNVNDSILEENIYKKSLCNSNSRWFLVEKSLEVKAFLFFLVDREKKVVEIKKFTINDSDKKKGLNEHLYRKVEQFAILQGMKSMRAEISADHLDVIDFFERKGWNYKNNRYEKYLK
ncbi:hypothetical protein CFK37_04065 [Virgibacillus phasianinus]|uniref:N-acetyltransferase domain-containing protein n=1 Tax=Virgibacillus phasianinus TaxID=2017483 RepID=A0A220U0C4_9BACI|nr:GNAT family N-acetyltransferase [Virgibacillus phasianinus]ASK61406.1 hypothetical protein CFK37_04065 [Virgibacillus phasianinus]